jgi:hypothetical protein
MGDTIGAMRQKGKFLILLIIAVIIWWYFHPLVIVTDMATHTPINGAIINAYYSPGFSNQGYYVQKQTLYGLAFIPRWAGILSAGWSASI